jgi:hypothetical protein
MIQATTIYCDDYFFAVSGKSTISGIYQGDIAIPRPGFEVTQLVAVFVVDFDLPEQSQELNLSVKVPGNEAVLAKIYTLNREMASPDRRHATMRIPVLIPRPKLHSGRIESFVRMGDETIEAGAISITVTGDGDLNP